jgi:hypothetical protein
MKLYNYIQLPVTRALPDIGSHTGKYSSRRTDEKSRRGSLIAVIYLAGASSAVQD